MKSKIGFMNDSDKIFVTMALWIAAVSLFATALSLPMLPNQVTIFYKTVDVDAEFFSKYNNLLIVLASVIPIGIILVAAALRRRGKMTHNFSSIMLFCIVLSGCFAGVTIYGIVQQFHASSAVARTDNNAMIALTASFIVSLAASLLPALFHSRMFAASAENRSERSLVLCSMLDYYWYVGTYVFLLSGAAGSFLVGGFAYIPLAVAIVTVVTFFAVKTHITLKRKAEAQTEQGTAS